MKFTMAHFLDLRILCSLPICPLIWFEKKKYGVFDWREIKGEEVFFFNLISFGSKSWLGGEEMTGRQNPPSIYFSLL